ncbi:hypothetical protein B0I35DRAFT_408018 [Stachybotrys elegans]|uniref:Biogenesis of lysosome-related organelles complex 1 subunit 1 n=1 Tax=Stachybotrys elegans TaxID=80388 RepID=A0A8K0SU69_9HYPO|nr:hypothetical protein B0I35DRAFT_408018 [Stachybotrys elegans]
MSTATKSSSSASGAGPQSPKSAVSSPSTTTQPAQAINAHAPPLQPTLPSAETQRHVAEARAAVVASLSNMVDSELQSRASILHDNAAALDKQEQDVMRATEGLRREREKLAREADAAARKLKEIGNVQNWAEVLERGFLVLEETLRLANGGTDDEDGGSSCSCSCSECGDRSDGEDDNGKTVYVNGSSKKLDGDDPAKDTMAAADADVAMTDAESVHGGWSDASRSLLEPESSTGTGRAKGSETASISTTS